jgi:hypothetical protein
MPANAEYRYFKDGFWRVEEVRIIHDDGGQHRVAAADILEYILKISAANVRPDHSMRLSVVMRKLGWDRATNGYVTIDGDRVKGYFRKVLEG